jgi:hypothetical protein
VDGLIFRRKRKSGPQSPEGSKRSKLAASPPTSDKGLTSSLLPEGAEDSHTGTQPAERQVSVVDVAEDVGGRGKEGIALIVNPVDSLPASECTQAMLSKLPMSGSEADRLLCLCDELAKVDSSHIHKTARSKNGSFCEGLHFLGF